MHCLGSSQVDLKPLMLGATALMVLLRSLPNRFGACTLPCTETKHTWMGNVRNWFSQRLR